MSESRFDSLEEKSDTYNTSEWKDFLSSVPYLSDQELAWEELLSACKRLDREKIWPYAKVNLASYELDPHFFPTRIWQLFEIIPSENHLELTHTISSYITNLNLLIKLVTGLARSQRPRAITLCYHNLAEKSLAGMIPDRKKTGHPDLPGFATLAKKLSYPDCFQLISRYQDLNTIKRKKDFEAIFSISSYNPPSERAPKNQFEFKAWLLVTQARYEFAQKTLQEIQLIYHPDLAEIIKGYFHEISIQTRYSISAIEQLSKQISQQIKAEQKLVQYHFEDLEKCSRTQFIESLADMARTIVISHKILTKVNLNTTNDNSARANVFAQINNFLQLSEKRSYIAKFFLKSDNLLTQLLFSKYTSEELASLAELKRHFQNMEPRCKAAFELRFNLNLDCDLTTLINQYPALNQEPLKSLYQRALTLTAKLASKETPEKTEKLVYSFPLTSIRQAKSLIFFPERPRNETLQQQNASSLSFSPP